jgi:paired small multidrug resistance pump
MMNLQWFDFVGFAGVMMVLIAYLALQTERLSGTGMIYSLLNALGAAGILVPVVYAESMNYSVLFIEAAWIAISLYGMWHSLKRKIIKPKP